MPPTVPVFKHQPVVALQLTVHLYSHSQRGGGTDGVGDESKEEVTGTRVQGWEGLTGTGSLHSPFPLFFSSLLICDS